MKKIVRKLCIFMAALTLTACGKTYGTEVYGGAVAALADDEAWEFVELGAKAPLMLVSSHLIEDGRTNSQSAECEAYYWIDEAVLVIADLKSDSEKYPLRAAEDGIYLMENGQYCRYALDEEMKLLEKTIADEGEYGAAEPILFGYGASGR